MNKLSYGVVLSLVMATAGPAAATDSQWRLTGSNTLRVEHYDVDGDERFGRYSDEGTFQYNELNLNLSGRRDAGELWRFQFSGVMNENSPYRSAETGFVPEKMSLYHERMDVALPFRAELGDIFMRFSPLTLQRSMTGARVELLPAGASADRQHSVTLVAGTDKVDWLEPDFQSSRYRGASWAVADNRHGRLSVNVVQHSRDGDQGAQAHNEWVASVAAEKSFDVAGQDLVAQAEFARLNKDVAPGSDQPEQADAVTGQISGQNQHKSLNYQLNYERYDEGFNPAGAGTPADYRSMRGQAGIKLTENLEVQGHRQRTTQGVDKPDPVQTDTHGVAIKGSVKRPGGRSVKAAADVTLQNRKSKSGDIDRRTTSTRLELGLPTTRSGETRIGAGWTGMDDRHTEGTDRIIRQFSVSHGETGKIGDYEYNARVGAVYQVAESGEVEQTSVSPTASVSVRKGRHQAALNLGFNSSETNVDYGVDVDTYSMGASYEYSRGRHTVGIEVERDLRQPNGAEDTDSLRAGAFWRYNFDITG